MRILVTGVASMVGSHLADRLLAEGHEVVGVDDFTSGSWANVVHLAHDPAFLFVEHDVERPFDADVDVVFHLAIPSTGGEHGAVSDPLRAATTCVSGTRNVAQVARGRGATLVLATALDVACPATACAEAMLAGKARVVRIANPYGPRMAPYDRVGRWVVAALRGTAAGSEVTRVTWVFDAVESLLSAAFAGTDGDVSVAPFRPVEASEIAAIASDHESPPPSLRVPLHLREGIRLTISWFEERVGGVRAAAGVASPRSSGIFVQNPQRQTG